MNYIGSKHKLIPFIKKTIYSVVGQDLSNKIFCDIFAGTGIVGRNFKTEVKTIISNDLEYYSYILNQNYIGNHQPIINQNELISELNSVKSLEGFIFKHYCRGGIENRKYFSDENGKKIDTIRQNIENWKTNNKIDNCTYYFLLASLLESADKVANTASVYGAYLKHLKKSASKILILSSAEFELCENIHLVFQKDSNQLIKEIEGDILYLDPPYNTRQYGANYHILNTIAEYKDFVPKGKTGLNEYKKSKYCSKQTVTEELEYLIRYSQFEYIFLSYNNEGLMSVDKIKNIMEKYGKYDLSSINYQRFKADKDENRNHKASETKEYLHILQKNG
ncbi:MAG: DNA adenine methylase [Candidatus Marinimicrobia bacterium]|nr:DNA adenine methylase [Candidatus Neomarinimicrobiota bacterium]MBL7023543.1 DNA adenine methylase [Candidatus Neomarinimicrobiota bacterium]MBL7109567.1 DNA adenine methylase [Candidatus Neomarinimicrobiota bacterium]